MAPTIGEMKNSLEGRGWNRGRSHDATRTIYAMVGPTNTPEGLREAGKLTHEIANHISLRHLRRMFRGDPLAGANKARLLAALFPPPTPPPPPADDARADEGGGEGADDGADKKKSPRSSPGSGETTRRRSNPTFVGVDPASIPMWSKHSRIVAHGKKGFDPEHLTKHDPDAAVAERARAMFEEYALEHKGDGLDVSYLYLLIDPEVLRLADPKGFERGRPSLEAFVSAIFYVGEGVGNRVHTYEKAADNPYHNEHGTPKIQHILKLREKGLKKIVCVPFENRTKEEVQDLESALIYGLVAAGRKFAPKQTLGKNEIANRSRGHYHKTHDWLPHEMLDLSRWLIRQSHEAFLERFDAKACGAGAKSKATVATPKPPTKSPELR